MDDQKRKNSEDELKEIGRKGGQSQGKENNPGNFVNREPGEMSEDERDYSDN